MHDRAQHSLMARAQAARSRGGVGELIRAGRRQLARLIYPGELPRKAKAAPARSAPPRRKPAAAVRASQQPPAQRPNALTVDLAVARAWFEQRRPTYERLAASVAPHFDPAGTVFDIGANVGYFTQVLGEVAGLSGTVHLFEPVPNLASLCRENLADVPYRTEVHEFGLADEDATIALYVANSGNLGWNTIVAGRRSDGMAQVDIQVRNFDLIGIDTVPDFIKIDVEGAEYRVLAGMLPALRRWPVKPPILCEIGWGTTGHPEWDKELEMFAALRELGYRFVDLDLAPVDVTTLSRTTDVMILQ